MGADKTRTKKGPFPSIMTQRCPTKVPFFPPRGIQPASPLVGKDPFLFFFLWRGERGEGIFPLLLLPPRKGGGLGPSKYRTQDGGGGGKKKRKETTAIASNQPICIMKRKREEEPFTTSQRPPTPSSQAINVELKHFF